MNKNTIELLAIDGGGTKTLAHLVSADGKILGKGKSGASNYLVAGVDGAKEALNHAILAAFDDAGIKDCRLVDVKKAIFALAGIDTPKDKIEVDALVQDVINTTFIKIEDLIVENDCLSALLGASENQPSVLLIAGTGSIVFAYDGKGKKVRSGGWGHRIGDEGGAYWIGKRAIQSVLKALDGREHETLLSELILEKLGLSKIEDLYNWIYSASYSVEKLGSLAVVVDEANKRGDIVSKRILNAAAEELTLLVETILKKIDIHEGGFKLILQGGVLHHNTNIRNQVLQRIQQKYDKVEIIMTSEEPIQNIIKRGLKFP